MAKPQNISEPMTSQIFNLRIMRNNNKTLLRMKKNFIVLPR